MRTTRIGKASKHLAALILTGFFAFVLTSTALYANDINVTIYGQQVTFGDQQPVIIDGRTLVPVRGVFELMGFEVDWDDANRQAILESEDYIVIITIGSSVFTTNGVEHTFDVPAQTIGGRTMVPIRLVLESVGYYLDWDGGTQTVLISSTPIGAPAIPVAGITPYGRQVAEEFLMQFTSMFQTPGLRDISTGNFYISGQEGWVQTTEPPLVSFGGDFGGAIGDMNFWAAWDVSRSHEPSMAFDSHGNLIENPPFRLGRSFALGFSLYDFDGSGIPEIIIWFAYEMDGAGGGPRRIFRYIDGAYRAAGQDFHGNMFNLYRGNDNRVILHNIWHTDGGEWFVVNYGNADISLTEIIQPGTNEPLTPIHSMVTAQQEITQSIRQSLGLAD